MVIVLIIPLWKIEAEAEGGPLASGPLASDPLVRGMEGDFKNKIMSHQIVIIFQRFDVNEILTMCVNNPYSSNY